MSRLGGFVEPVVVAAVHVADWSAGELGWIEIVEAGEVDGDVVAADLGDVAPAERRDLAHGAEPALDEALAPEAVAKLLGAGQQAERRGERAGAPPARLPAVGAVALAGARRQIEVGLESDLPAATAAPIRPLCHVGRL